jgi:hypothetical protein
MQVPLARAAIRLVFFASDVLGDVLCIDVANA